MGGGNETHLFLQITSTCCDDGGCGATFTFVVFLVAASGRDGDGNKRSMGCSPWSPASSVVCLLGISCRSKQSSAEICTTAAQAGVATQWSGR